MGEYVCERVYGCVSVCVGCVCVCVLVCEFALEMSAEDFDHLPRNLSKRIHACRLYIATDATPRDDAIKFATKIVDQQFVLRQGKCNLQLGFLFFLSFLKIQIISETAVINF